MIHQVPPHTHAREDECAYVLEGELTFDVGGEVVVASAGSFVLKPRGVYHALCNTGTVPNRHLGLQPGLGRYRRQRRHGARCFGVDGSHPPCAGVGAGGEFMGAADEFGLGSGRVPSRIGVGAGIRYGGCVRWCSRWTVVD